jgi:hypothetical protein
MELTRIHRHGFLEPCQVPTFEQQEYQRIQDDALLGAE